MVVPASTNAFDRQDAAWPDGVLPVDLPRDRRGGRRHRRLVEIRRHRGAVIGLDRFGESAPAGVLFKEFGFTDSENVVKAVEAFI